MSQTMTAAPAPDAPVAPPDSRLASGAAALRHALEGSPGRLRLVSAICVIACVISGLLGGYALQRRSAALDDARDSAAHLILLQRVQTDLVEADADATNGYLAFGLEPLATQQDYATSMAAATRRLAEAAGAGAREAAVLAPVNDAVAQYNSDIASARANNRRQIQVGQSYLLIASSTLMRGQIIPGLQALAAADTKDIDHAYSRAGNARWWLVLAAILGLGALLVGQLYLTRHSRRLLNLPAAAATVVMLVALLIAAVVMSGAQSRANDVRSGDLAKAIAISNSRVAAFNAKSIESLGLAVRGSLQASEDAWEKAAGASNHALPSDEVPARKALAKYAAQHAVILKKDRDNQWHPAVTMALDTGPGSANQNFDDYASASDAALKTRAVDATSGLAKAGDFLFPAGLLVLVVGALAAAGAWYGVSLRLDEYR